jgi:hypothetical protein
MRYQARKKWNGCCYRLHAKTPYLFVVLKEFELPGGGQAMNVRNTFSGDNSETLDARSGVHATQRRSTSIGSQRESGLRPVDAIPDQERREVVAQRFLSMNEAHDRIRTKLLASSR